MIHFHRHWYAEKPDFGQLAFCYRWKKTLNWFYRMDENHQWQEIPDPITLEELISCSSPEEVMALIRKESK